MNEERSLFYSFIKVLLRFTRIRFRIHICVYFRSKFSEKKKRIRSLASLRFTCDHKQRDRANAERERERERWWMYVLVMKGDARTVDTFLSLCEWEKDPFLSLILTGWLVGETKLNLLKNRKIQCKRFNWKISQRSHHLWISRFLLTRWQIVFSITQFGLVNNLQYTVAFHRKVKWIRDLGNDRYRNDGRESKISTCRNIIS